MSKITVYEQGNFGIDYEILSRQCVQLNFKDGKVEYFSISTQWDIADTIEDAIRNILEADKKYEGKAPLRYMMDKNINEVCGIKISKIPTSSFNVSLDAVKQAFEKWQKESGWFDIINDIKELNDKQ